MAETPIQLTGDLTQSFIRTTESSMGILDAIKDCILLTRQAKAQAKADAIHAQAETDRKLIDAGLAKAEDGKVTYLLGQNAITAYLLSLQNRRIENIQGCIRFVVDDLAKVEPERVSCRIDEDFIDEWMEGASNRKDEYARRLWGRILAREMLDPGSISLRALHTLKQMDKKEAEIFTRIAPYAFNSFILRSDNISVASAYDGIIMRDAGIAEMSMNTPAEIPFVGTQFAARGAQWGFVVHKYGIGNMERMMNIYGIPLTPTGASLLKVPDLEPITPEILKIIFEMLKERNQDIIGIDAYRITDGGKICPEDLICEYTPG